MRARVALPIVWTFWLLYGTSLPAGSLSMMFPLGGLVTIGLTVAFVAVYVVQILTSRIEKDPSSHGAGRKRLWVFPIAMLIVGSALLWNWPLLLRFELSRAAFDAEVARIQTVLASAPAATQPLEIPYSRDGKRIGLFKINHITVVDDAGQRRFYFSTDTAFVESFGLLFCDERPRLHGRTGTLRPPWYPYSRD
jgi:hypothetical protein